jgi:hypothetical protein
MLLVEEPEGQPEGTVLVLRVAMWVLMLPRAVGAEDTAALDTPLIARLDAATAQQTDAFLASVIRTQNAAGVYAPGDDGTVLLTRPVLATMAFDAYASTHNTASLAQAANSISRYYSYLFSSADRDGDHLIESTTTTAARQTRVEDPAFNALLAGMGTGNAYFNIHTVTFGGVTAQVLLTATGPRRRRSGWGLRRPLPISRVPASMSMAVLTAMSPPTRRSSTSPRATAGIIALTSTR